jgi:Tol biopolymer transport system component
MSNSDSEFCDPRKSTNPAGPSMLVALHVDSGRERIIYRLPKWAPSAGNPKFSPDGRRVLFGYWCAFGDQCPASTRAHRNATLATIDVDGRRLRKLRLPSDADSGVWSPDGSHIAYRCRGQGAATPFRICTSRLDGSDFRRFPWELDSAHPSWR